VKEKENLSKPRRKPEGRISRGGKAEMGASGGSDGGEKLPQGTDASHPDLSRQRGGKVATAREEKVPKCKKANEDR